ncbi:hypothetical protein G5I_11285 [Acromyrmex echinatior]|uniref:Uncharacterized protein n=1 Tax=Acromyrmex echinatior TaxID=103372 RepID=F4WZ72_ACREC|nr:hypothetical protein G5I_11285 [Acromyrmex echinatior]
MRVSERRIYSETSRHAISDSRRHFGLRSRPIVGVGVVSRDGSAVGQSNKRSRSRKDDNSDTRSGKDEIIIDFHRLALFRIEYRWENTVAKKMESDGIIDNTCLRKREFNSM